MMRLRVNGEELDVNVDSNMPLLWVLRDEFALTGTKYGCGAGVCGACTVLISGRPVRSCVYRIADVTGDITTIEGVGTPENLHKVQSAWIEEQVPQCGYCQSGQIVAAVTLLASNPDPDDEAIDQALNDHICRCGTYSRVRAAIHAAASNES